MSGNYPPGVSASTPNAPWNDDPVETCDECGGVYAEGGHEEVGEPEQQGCNDCGNYWEDEERECCPECGSDDLHGIPCPNAGMNMRDLDEARKSRAAEAKMERQREREYFEDG